MYIDSVHTLAVDLGLLVYCQRLDGYVRTIDVRHGVGKAGDLVEGVLGGP